MKFGMPLKQRNQTKPNHTIRTRKTFTAIYMSLENGMNLILPTFQRTPSKISCHWFAITFDEEGIG